MYISGYDTSVGTIDNSTSHVIQKSNNIAVHKV